MDHQQLEEATRASLLEEEMRQQRAREVDVGPSARVRTTEDVERVDENTTKSVGIVDESATDGVPSVDPTGSQKLESPVS